MERSSPATISPVGIIGPALRRVGLPVFAGNHFPSWYNGNWNLVKWGFVFAGNHFPSWYNSLPQGAKWRLVFAGNHFPSWYNNLPAPMRGLRVFAGNHFPSWYNVLLGLFLRGVGLRRQPFPQLV